MNIEENEINKFKDKKRFVLYPCIGQSWVVEIYDFEDRILGRIVVRNKAELIQSIDESMPDDNMEVDFGIN